MPVACVILSLRRSCGTAHCELLVEVWLELEVKEREDNEQPTSSAKERGATEPEAAVARPELSPMGFAFSESDQLEHGDELGLSSVEDFSVASE